MFYKRKYLKKATVFVLAMWTFSQSMTVAVLAEEIEATETPPITTEAAPAPVEDTQTAEPTPPPAAVTVTGDAMAVTETENEMNLTETTIAEPTIVPENDKVDPSESPAPGSEETTLAETEPEISATENEDVSAEVEVTEIENNNEAIVTSEVTTSAETGSNTSIGHDGEVSITTGEATAETTVQTTVNENITTVTADNQTDVQVENTSLAQINNTSQTVAESGNNLAAENNGEAKIDTGTALAEANVVNLVNLNTVGSNFGLVIIDVEADHEGDIDLNAVWDRINEEADAGKTNFCINDNSAHVTVSIVNQSIAEVKNEVTVAAVSGENTAVLNDGAEIDTGDATAVANVTNIVNANVTGVKFFFGIINVLTDKAFNIILPPKEKFADEGQSEPRIMSVNNNQSGITDQIETLADSGNNVSAGAVLQSTQTGSAEAITNVTTISNTNIENSNWLSLIFNNTGGWLGKIIGWGSPDSETTPGFGTNLLSFSSEVEENPNVTDTEMRMSSTNQARVENNISVVAVTGNNSSINNNRQSIIATGDALALANVFNLVNLNITGGKWFMGTVNVLNNWNGNAIFAYPDLAVTMGENYKQFAPGETTEYAISYKNVGHDTADGVRLSIQLPEGTEIPGGNCIDRTCAWTIGRLVPDEERNMTIQLRIKPDFRFDQTAENGLNFITRAKAAESGNSREITIGAHITSENPDYSQANNRVSVQALVFEKTTEISDPDPRQPVLSIKAKNNVNEYVNPGDTVSFDIEIQNTADVSATETRVVQELYDAGGNLLSVSEFKVGSVDPVKKGTLRFGLKIPANTVGGRYFTRAQAIGKAPNGNQVNSEYAPTQFLVRGGLSYTFVPEVQAAPEEVLGDQTQLVLPMKNQKDDVLWLYVLIFLLSSWMTADRFNRKFINQ